MTEMKVIKKKINLENPSGWICFKLLFHCSFAYKHTVLISCCQICLADCKWKDFYFLKFRSHQAWKAEKTKSDDSLQEMLLLASKRNQSDRTEDLMATPKSRIENAPPFGEWPCYSGTFRSLLSSLIYSPQIKLLLFSPCLNWYSVKGEHRQLRKKKIWFWTVLQCDVWGTSYWLSPF